MQVHVLRVVGSLTFSADRPAHSNNTCNRPTVPAIGAGGDCSDNFRAGGDCLDIFFFLIFLTL